MTKNQFAHRHFVAFPVLACLIGVSVVHGNLSASVFEEESADAGITQESQESIVALPWSATAIVLSGEGIERDGENLRLHDGTVLIGSPYMTELFAGDFRVVAIGGSFHITIRDGTLTIASLTTPVLIVQGNRRMVVPPEWQWHSSGLTSLDAGVPLWRQSRQMQGLPRRFMERQLEQLHAAAEEYSAGTPLPDSRGFIGLEMREWLMPIRLPAAEERADAEWSESVLGFIRGRIEAGDLEAALSVLDDSAYDDAFRSPEAHRALIALLADAEDASLLTMPLLTRLSGDPELGLLLSQHVRWRDEASTLFGAGDDPELSLNKLFTIPYAAPGSQALSPFAIERWGMEASGILSTMENAGALLDALLREVIPLVSHAEERGYPERSRAMAESLRAMLRESPSRSPFAEEAFAHIDALDQMDLRPVDFRIAEVSESDEPAPQQAPVSDTPEEVPEYDPAIVEGRAYVALHDAGALFTVETKIQAIGPTIASFQGLVFSTPERDRGFDFRYDVETGLVSRIVTGGKEYPYELPLQAFAAWAIK